MRLLITRRFSESESVSETERERKRVASEREGREGVREIKSRIVFRGKLSLREKRGTNGSDCLASHLTSGSMSCQSDPNHRVNCIKGEKK